MDHAVERGATVIMLSTAYQDNVLYFCYKHDLTDIFLFRNALNKHSEKC